MQEVRGKWCCGAPGHPGEEERAAVQQLQRGAGPKGQIRRPGKGPRPLPSGEGIRCCLEEGLSEEAEKELQEAAGGEKPAAGKEAEARGQVRPEAWVQPLGAAAQADGVEAGELQAMGDKAVAVAASRAREAGEVRGAAMA